MFHDVDSITRTTFNSGSKIWSVIVRQPSSTISSFGNKCVLLPFNIYLIIDHICNSLSVTKWIHLLHGDEGIRVLFRKIYSLLKPGGRLILEPQTWKSYHKRKFTSAKTEANYGRIQLRPKDFPLCLIDEIGFKSSEFIRVCQTSSKGFRRPIYVIQK